MKHLILLSNHLNEKYINQVKPDQVTVLLSKQQFTYFNYHQFRILYHQAAAFHFAKSMNIHYVYINQWIDYFGSISTDDTYIMYKPNDVWMDMQIKNATEHLDIVFKKDLNFYFMDIQKEMGKPPYKLNPLYHKWRRKFDVLMEDNQPIGGKYSYDVKNRNRPPKTLQVPKPLIFEMDDETRKIYHQIQKDFANHPSSPKDFVYPLTKNDAEALLNHFINHRLKHFGKYQDAMMKENPFMIHSLLSASINLGLLYVKDIVEKVEASYRKGIAPIESVEGFIRQIIGWREYIRGVYLSEMTEDYHLKNHLNHQNQLPSLMYNASTTLECLRVCVNETIENGYNHHIQRLMVIGNLMNLMNVSPQSVREWFNEMYIDSFDWVVTPNVIGMAMYADEGLMSTKPYISSANYINKMSNYCKSCQYNPKEKYTSNACPVNALYYIFLNKYRKDFKNNPRMRYMYLNLDRLSNQEIQELEKKSLEYVKIK